MKELNHRGFTLMIAKTGEVIAYRNELPRLAFTAETLAEARVRISEFWKERDNGKRKNNVQKL